MSAPRQTIHQQRTAVEALLTFAIDSGVTPTDSPIAEGIRQAVLSLAWIERKAELIKEMDRLDRDAPGVLSLLKEFPGAQIAEVR